MEGLHRSSGPLRQCRIMPKIDLRIHLGGRESRSSQSCSRSTVGRVNGSGRVTVGKTMATARFDDEKYTHWLEKYTQTIVIILCKRRPPFHSLLFAQASYIDDRVLCQALAHTYSTAKARTFFLHETALTESIVLIE
jgi:hypothetical protein